MTPEASLGGALARIRNGDVVCLDSLAGTLTIDAADLATRDNAPRPVGKRQAGFGRQLFDNLRAQTSSAESGASLFGTGEI
jgi:phosphogluconate dehydratase